MNFAQVKSVTLPQGKVTKIIIGTTLLWQAKPKEEPVVNLIDTVGVTKDKRISSSGALKDYSGYFATGLIPVQKGDVIRTRGADFDDGGSWGGAWCYKADGSYWTFTYTVAKNSPISNAAWDITVDESGNLELTVTSNSIGAIRLCGIGSGDGLLVTKNQEIP